MKTVGTIVQSKLLGRREISLCRRKTVHKIAPARVALELDTRNFILRSSYSFEEDSYEV